MHPGNACAVLWRRKYDCGCSISSCCQTDHRTTDRAKGQHADVVVDGDRAFIYYFVHQVNEAEAATDARWNQRTVIQVAELVFKDGWLDVDRDKDLAFRLNAPSP